MTSADLFKQLAALLGYRADVDFEDVKMVVSTEGTVVIMAKPKPNVSLSFTPVK